MHSHENDPMGIVGACPTCKTAYIYQNVRILRKAKEQTLFHLTCDKCKHSMLFSVLRQKEGVMCSGLMTDCSFEDAKLFHGKEIVSIGDVMEAHEALDIAWSQELFSK
ncbi:hypothetical protein HON52_02925 [Candidatus Uhrbacteria bacterium]|jgi:hypothetical protein|nr:hypothetical protein [Candidatus Uhrbacteria bacterium]